MKELIAKFRGAAFVIGCRLFRPNIHIGQNLKVYKRLIIHGKGQVIIGDNCTVKGVSGESCKYVTLDTYSPEAEISVGNGACLLGARISSKFFVSLGDDLFIEDASITDTDYHSITRERGEPQFERRAKNAVLIGDRVSIGCRSIIAKGVRIGDDTVIMPGSIVTRSLPTMCIAMGNPAKPCREDLFK
jgi:acetyltransferase-like isoleucine patch superfamily enzyme